MLDFFKGLFDSNRKDIDRLSRIVEVVNSHEPDVKNLSDEALRDKTMEFKKRLAGGETLDDILPEAFAVVREAARRTLGQRHYDVQLMGGIALHEGNIAEMKTGEGKTLVATAPVYLNALAGKGVHVVTVNDYLARRDSEWMAPVYRFLGLTVGCIVHELDSVERKAAYACDVVYGTNNEFGFDYLRDNMVLSPDDIVQRELHYAIVDEVDSILIDEARTPLIISGQAEAPTDMYYQVAKLIPKLTPEDYTVDEKAHTAELTDSGMDKMQKWLKVDLYEEKNVELNHHVQQALKADTLMHRDQDYIVKDGQVIIVDEFTGRLMFGRRYSDGLHQAIEAKEGVKIERESQTLATITFQNFFRMYSKLAGMTGTAATEESEFRKIYGLNVVIIPTNQAMVRKDHPDVVYKTEKVKLDAVIEEIKECHAKGQPVLVGTRSIEKSEQVGHLLKLAGIHSFEILNAKNHEREAEIIAQAGRHGAITIATNMAGRGTDILLGGNPDYSARQKLRAEGFSHETILAAVELVTAASVQTPEVQKARVRYEEALVEMRQEALSNREKVVAAGGLHILGTERHESRRIDNQLRGRSGRQGDPGSSRFYVAMTDELMRLFGGDRIMPIMERLGWEDDLPIEHPQIAKAIENAQKRVEAHNFDIRKNVLEYDDVLNQQRHAIYDMRRKALFKESLADDMVALLTTVAFNALDVYANEKVYPEDWDLEGLVEHLNEVFALPRPITLDDVPVKDRGQLKESLSAAIGEAYALRESQIGSENMRMIERYFLLRIIDSKWMDHLKDMDALREGIGLRAYGQREPLLEYRLEASQMFKAMLDAVQEEVAHYVFRVQLSVEPPAEARRVTNVHTNRENDGTVDGTHPVAKNKVGRNDPCPCGSGKKYKKCCLASGKYE